MPSFVKMNAAPAKNANTALMDEFHGALIPVSTDRILGGFQKVSGFVQDERNPQRMVASLFKESATTDYYKTTLFLRANGLNQDVYLASIGYEDDDERNPISTAIRIGFVIYEPGQNKQPVKEYVCVINKADNPQADYNTATGQEGYVLDSSKTDGTTILMENLFSSDNFCEYNSSNGAVTLKEKSQLITTLPGNESGNYGTPVQVDVYVWLEGCDKDCCDNLSGKMLKKVALSFAGVPREE